MKISQELKREFVMSEKEFINKIDNIFIKLFEKGITKIILDSTYVINKGQDNEIHVTELMLDRINHNIMLYDSKSEKYMNLNSSNFITKYQLLDKILF